MNANNTPQSTYGASRQTDAHDAAWHIEVFFDGDCPICRRETAMLRKLDARRRIRFTDIAADDFDPQAYGITVNRLMSEIHARLPDGSWIAGVEVFRRLYGVVGLRWLIPVTRLPGISHTLEWGYRFFARNRLKWTGRCAADQSCARRMTGRGPR